MSGPPRDLALAGTGHIAAVHVLAAHALDIPVVAVASRSRSRAQAFAREVGTGTRGCAYESLPCGAGAVVVATPPAQHASHALGALAAGATVLVEKPLATTLADADRLVAAAAGTSARAVYAENLAFAPLVERALAHAASTAPTFIEARMLSPRPDWGSFLHDSWGGGVLFDTGAHPIALALLAAGADTPVAVTARLERAHDAAVDDVGEAEIVFASGLRAHIVASWRHDDRVRDLQIASATSVVRAELLPSPSLEVDGEPVPTTGPTTGPTSGPTAGRRADPARARLYDGGYVGQLRALFDPATTDPPRCPLALGRAVLDVVCGAYAAAAAGTTVALPFAGPRDATPLALWRAG